MNNKLSLPDLLSSYKVLIVIIILFIFLMILLVISNPNGFNKSFGYQILYITGPMLFLITILINQYFTAKQNPLDSVLYNIMKVSPESFDKIVKASIAIIGITTFFMLLYFGGIFSNNPPKNNVETIINFIIIAVFIITAHTIYKHYSSNDESILKSLNLSEKMMDALKSKDKYLKMFILFAFAVMIIYFLNPFGIMTNYGGRVIFFSLFVGMILTILIILYDGVLSDPAFFKDDHRIIGILETFMKYFKLFIVCIVPLAISGWLMWTLYKSLGISELEEGSGKYIKAIASFIGIGIVILIALAFIFKYLLESFLKSDDSSNVPKENSNFFRILVKALYVLVALGGSMGLMYAVLKVLGVFDFDTNSPSSWFSIILNFIILLVIFGILFRLLDVQDFLEKNSFWSFVVNALFYLPCLLLFVFYYIIGLLPKSFKSSFSTYTSTSTSTYTSASSKEFKTFEEFKTTPTTPFEVFMLVLSLILLGGYFGWTMFGKKYFRRQYLKQGGKLLVNEPVSTDKLTNVTSYQSLSGSERFDYQYALSFWFYLDSFPPSTNSSYSKLVSLLSYGENPNISYSSQNNTLYITVKQSDTEGFDTLESSKTTDITNEKLDEYIESKNTNKQSLKDAIESAKLLTFDNNVDSSGNRIIYEHPNVQLQKWNHVLLNYSGGTLDVFYNGKLVKTAIGVVPYMKNDMLTIGTENGIVGNVSNMIYFNKPLDIKTIDTLYVELKNNNNPSLPNAPYSSEYTEYKQDIKNINKI